MKSRGAAVGKGESPDNIESSIIGVFHVSGRTATTLSSEGTVIVGLGARL
jgi:hypothetical protein